MTSHTTTEALTSPSIPPPREPLRLRLSGSPGMARLDGGWWPQSRDLERELADLVDHFPVDVGRVQRVLFSRPDWDTQPHRVPVARGRVKTGSYPSDDTHEIVLNMSTRTELRLLVVPAGHPAGEQALSTAADPASHGSSAEILGAL